MIFSNLFFKFFLFRKFKPRGRLFVKPCFNCFYVVSSAGVCKTSFYFFLSRLIMTDVFDKAHPLLLDGPTEECS